MSLLLINLHKLIAQKKTTGQRPQFIRYLSFVPLLHSIYHLLRFFEISEIPKSDIQQNHQRCTVKPPIMHILTKYEEYEDDRFAKVVNT